MFHLSHREKFEKKSKKDSFIILWHHFAMPQNDSGIQRMKPKLAGWLEGTGDNNEKIPAHWRPNCRAECFWMISMWLMRSCDWRLSLRAWLFVRVQKKKDIECECACGVCFSSFYSGDDEAFNGNQGAVGGRKKAKAGCLVISSSSGCGSTKTQRPSPQTVFNRAAESFSEISQEKTKKLEKDK